MPLMAFAIVSTSGCSNDERPGFDQVINPVWEYDYKVGLSSGIEPVIANDKVIYASKVESSPDQSANDQLIALSKTDGALLWKWSDHFESNFQSFDAKSLKPVDQSLMAVTIGGRNFALGLESGETVWKNRNINTTSSSDVSKISNKIYRTDITDPGLENGNFIERLMQADIASGVWKEVFKSNGGDSLRQGLQVPSHYFETEGDTILIFTNTIVDLKRNLIRPRLLSYNLSKDSLYYDVLLEEPDQTNAVDWFPVIDQDKVFLAVDDLLVCRNVLTGEPVWTLQLNANLLFSGFILVGDEIFAKSEGSGILWSIDKNTGKVNWQKPSTGISSSLSYFNNTLYFVGDMKLQIVDASNGENLAEIFAPSSVTNPNDTFNDFCTIDPSTGRIYLASLSRAYCYPAFR